MGVLPQHSMVPPVRSPHAWSLPAVTALKAPPGALPYPVSPVSRGAAVGVLLPGLEGAGVVAARGSESHEDGRSDAFEPEVHARGL